MLFRSAICSGASPVAAVFGSAPGSATSPQHRIQPKPHLPPRPFILDITTWHGLGHFYLALTGLDTACLRRVLSPGVPFLKMGVWRIGWPPLKPTLSPKQRRGRSRLVLSSIVRMGPHGKPSTPFLHRAAHHETEGLPIEMIRKFV